MKYVLNDNVFSSQRTMEPRVNMDKVITKVVITINLPDGMTKRRIARRVHKFMQWCEGTGAKVKAIYYCRKEE